MVKGRIKSSGITSVFNLDSRKMVLCFLLFQDWMCGQPWELLKPRQKGLSRLESVIFLTIFENGI